MQVAQIPWWYWIVGALLMFGGELLTPGGFYIFFFGVGALAVGLASAFGLPMSMLTQSVVFVGISIASLALFRKPLLERMGELRPAYPVDSLIGEEAIALQDLAIAEMGKAELRGTTWNVKNIGDSPIQRQQRCRVDRVDGLTLCIRAR